MTEKVKVTQKQFDWLERYELTQDQIDHYIDIQPYKKRPDSPIVDWSASKVAKALYIGYEVEPEYSKGEIVKWYGEIVEIMYPQTADHIDDGNCYFTIKRSDDTTMNNVERQKLQKTTTSEKDIYKECQKWAKIGRKPDEYHHYDIAFDDFNGCHVEVDDPTIFATPYIRVANLDDKSDSREIDPVDLTLVCPADKRFDHD